MKKLFILALASTVMLTSIEMLTAAKGPAATPISTLETTGETPRSKLRGILIVEQIHLP